MSYNIEDLIYNTNSVDAVEERPQTLNNNKPTMNLFEQRKFDKFADSGRVDEIESNIVKAEDIQVKLNNISNAFGNIVYLLHSDVVMLNDAVNNADIKRIESIAESLEVQLEAVNNKTLSDAVESLASLFGFNTSNGVNKKEKIEAINKAYGFKETKKKASK